MENVKNNFDEKVLKCIHLRLKEFGLEDEKSPDIIWSCNSLKYHIDIDKAPVPALLYFLLVKVLHFPLGYRGDKTHWAIPFTFNGVRCSLALEKFGLRLYIDKNGDTINPHEVMDKLQRSVKILERDILQQFGQEQTAKGNVIVANKFTYFDDMYTYFRMTAEQSFVAWENEQDNCGIVPKGVKHQTSGNYNVVAMVNAYFSRLEHILVFCLAFTNDSKKIDLLKFMESNWGDKYKDIISLFEERKGKKLYDRLLRVKEDFRNPLAHGGFEKNGGSLYFHLPGIGAIPAKLSDMPNRQHFNFLMSHETTFKELCELFDCFDKWLEIDNQPYAMLYLKSGLNIAFDASSIDEIGLASKNSCSFEDWLEAKSKWQDIHDNADY